VAGYTPILKGKAGEFEALRNLGSSGIPIRPILEIVPGKDDVATQVTKFATALRDVIVVGTIPAVDTVHVDRSAGPDFDALAVVARQLTKALIPLPMRPVFRLTDGPDRLASVAEVVQANGQGSCLRLGSERADPDAAESAATVGPVMAAAGQDPADVDLVIDLWAVSDERDVKRAQAVAAGMIDWASTRSWRSVTLASGAFPESISHLPKDTATPLPRLDARLWTTAQSQYPSIALDYGDYGVAHPALGQGARAPLPNLRYTTGTDWQVYRQASPKEAGNERFFRICRSVVFSEHFPGAGGEYSWGDHELSDRAHGRGGPGNAQKWRAYGTSHHLALVTDRLARLGEP
jgi:hypothetical protein